jgi:hypothetical protein
MASGLCLARCVELDMSVVAGFFSWTMMGKIEEIVNETMAVFEQKIVLSRPLKKNIMVGEIRCV